MKRNIIKIVSALCMSMVLSVFGIFSAGNALAAEVVFLDNNKSFYFETYDEYDKVLMEAGTPWAVLNSFSDTQKEFIAEYLNEDAVYESSESYVIETAGNLNEGIATASVSNLSSSLLKVTVNNYSMTVNGEKQNAIFPSFKWLANGYSVSNDSFSVALYNGWEVVPDATAQMTLHLKNANGTQQSKLYYPTGASQYGYSYKIPSSDGNSVPNGYYEGNSVFYATKKKTNATNAITVKYTHDASSSHSISYSINIGPASISVDSQNSNLMVYAANISI